MCVMTTSVLLTFLSVSSEGSILLPFYLAYKLLFFSAEPNKIRAQCEADTSNLTAQFLFVQLAFI